MAREKSLIVEQRGLILGEPNEYYTALAENFTVLSKMHFIYVSTDAELIDRLYTYEPMLILMELTPKNIGIAVKASRLYKYRQAVSVGLAVDENDSFKRLADEFVVTDTVLKTGDSRKDSFSVLRVYKLNVKYGINLKTVAKQMPVVTELTWHDASYDIQFLRTSISDKLDRLGVKRELAGHKYLIAAIAIHTAIHDFPEPKVLYQNIADYYGTTPAAVEKDIRYAIESAWVLGDIEYQHTIFGMSIDEEKGKPTNAEFIARLALDY